MLALAESCLPMTPALEVDRGSMLRRSGGALAILCLIATLIACLTPEAHGASLPLDAGTLLQQPPTLSSPGTAGGRFGEGIALSADGRTAIVSAPAEGPSGSAWIYVREGGTWSIQGPPLPGLGTPEPCIIEETGEPEACSYGLAVALSGDGNTALIGSPADKAGLGSARIYTRAGTSWTAGPVLTGQEEIGTGHFGRSVALSADGTTAIVGGSHNAQGGAAWIFNRAGSEWTPGPLLRGDEEIGTAAFGRSVAISADGRIALVGGPGDNHGAGAAWVFSGAGTAWEQVGGKLTAGAPTGRERFGRSVALSSDGTTALVGAPNYTENVGAAFAFQEAAGAWSQQGPAIQPATAIGSPRVGKSLAISGDGNLALLGGSSDNHGAGAAWQFSRSGESWTELGEATIGTEEHTMAQLGQMVALSADGTTALVGAPRYAGDTGGVWSLHEILAQPPTVDTIEPASGSPDGGTRVTVIGSGFLPGSTVSIGSPAVEVEVVSETEIRATTSSTAAGSYEVSVSDAEGTSSNGPNFTFKVPPPPEEPSPEPLAKTTSTQTTAPAPSSGTLAETTTKVGLPRFLKTGNLAPVSGLVLVKLPGSSAYVPLNGIRQVPFGTLVDATKGTVTVTTIAAGGKAQKIDFFGGAFKLLQRRNGQVVAVLAGGNFSVCPTARERAHRALARTATSRRHVVRKLWASGHGKYSTRGNYATGAVLGTRWLTVDRCNGTLIYVATDRVAVTNLVNHRHRKVRAHHSYFAAAP